MYCWMQVLFSLSSHSNSSYCKEDCKTPREHIRLKKKSNVYTSKGGWGAKMQHLKEISIICLYLTISPVQKDAWGSVWRATGCWGDEALESEGLWVCLRDYEGVYIQSQRPGAKISGLWGLLDQVGGQIYSLAWQYICREKALHHKIKYIILY